MKTQNTPTLHRNKHPCVKHPSDHDLVSLIYQPDFKMMQGIIIGRLQRQSKMGKSYLLS